MHPQHPPNTAIMLASKFVAFSITQLERLLSGAPSGPAACGSM